MRTNRRHLVQSALGLSAVVGFGNFSAALAAEASSVAALKAAGLDPLEAYARMFATTTKGAEVAWWLEGALPRDIEDVGAVDTIQEETVRIHRTESYGSGKLEFIWKEVGVFRDIRTGENPPERFDPVSGVTSKGGTLLDVARSRNAGRSISTLKWPVLATIAPSFIWSKCSPRITSLSPVAVQKMSPCGAAAAIVETRKPSIAACNARRGSTSVTITCAPSPRARSARPRPHPP